MLKSCTTVFHNCWTRPCCSLLGSDRTHLLPARLRRQDHKKANKMLNVDSTWFSKWSHCWIQIPNHNHNCVVLGRTSLARAPRGGIYFYPAAGKSGGPVDLHISHPCCHPGVSLRGWVVWERSPNTVSVCGWAQSNYRIENGFEWKRTSWIEEWQERRWGDDIFRLNPILVSSIYLNPFSW